MVGTLSPAVKIDDGIFVVGTATAAPVVSEAATLTPLAASRGFDVLTLELTLGALRRWLSGSPIDCVARPALRFVAAQPVSHKAHPVVRISVASALRIRRF